MNLVAIVRAAAVVLGAAIIVFAVWATPILWRDPDVKWAVLLLWPLAVGGIRLLRAGITGDSDMLRRMEARSAQLRAHRESYHEGDHGPS